jgi:hypothetical protein
MGVKRVVDLEKYWMLSIFDQEPATASISSKQYQKIPKRGNPKTPLSTAHLKSVQSWQDRVLDSSFFSCYYLFEVILQNSNKF